MVSRENTKGLSETVGMKSDAFDVTYRDGGVQFKSTLTAPQRYVSAADVESVVKALGTMVLLADYKTDPNNIGKKEFLGNVQVPILVDEARVRAEKKLIELIERL